MAISTTVKLVVREASTQAIPGVRVALFGDRALTDDRLGDAVTDGNGEARFTFAPQAYIDRNNRAPLGAPLLPDLFVEVYDALGAVVLSTRVSQVENRAAPLITVPISRELIASHRLHPPEKRRSAAEAQADWTAAWRKKISTGRPSPPVDLCLTRLIADVIAGAADPQNDLQKQLAVALDGRLSRDRIAQVSKLAREGVRWIDESGLLADRQCGSSSSPKEIYSLLVGPGGSLSRLSQSLLATTPPPRDRAGPAGAGRERTRLYDGWNDKCIDYFHRDQLIGPGLTDMQRYYHEPNDLIIVEPPSVAEVEVYEPALSHEVRLANVAERRMQVWVFDAQQGLVPETWEMAVDPGDPQLLVEEFDPRDGKQVLVTDVVPGQTVSIKGTGFISDKAKLTTLFAPWRAINADQILPQALHPETFQLDTTRLPSEAEVRGNSPTDGRDWVVFDWPANAGPGLYQVQLEFTNNTGLKTISHPVQDEDTCTIGLIDELKTIVLYFAVLPALQPGQVGARASKVECNSLTTPPIWPDDVALTAASQITRVDYVTTGGTARLASTSVASTAWDKGHAVCWPGQSLTPSQPNVLPNNEVTHLLQFDRAFSELLAIGFEASEIEGNFDRGVLVAIALVTIITLGVIFTVIIAVAWLVIVALTALTLSGTGAVVAAIIAGLWVAVGIACTAATALIVAVVSRADIVASPTTFLSGFELAVRLSNVRFHQKLWRFPRPLTGNIHEVRTQRDTVGLHEQYVGSDYGATYTVYLALPTH